MIDVDVSVTMPSSGCGSYDTSKGGSQILIRHWVNVSTKHWTFFYITEDLQTDYGV